MFERDESGHKMMNEPREDANGDSLHGIVSSSILPHRPTLFTMPTAVPTGYALVERVLVPSRARPSQRQSTHGRLCVHIDDLPATRILLARFIVYMCNDSEKSP